jgi:hypothetical protein
MTEIVTFTRPDDSPFYQFGSQLWLCAHKLEAALGQQLDKTIQIKVSTTRFAGSTKLTVKPGILGSNWFIKRKKYTPTLSTDQAFNNFTCNAKAVYFKLI